MFSTIRVRAVGRPLQDLDMKAFDVHFIARSIFLLEGKCFNFTKKVKKLKLACGSSAPSHIGPVAWCLYTSRDGPPLAQTIMEPLLALLWDNVLWALLPTTPLQQSCLLCPTEKLKNYPIPMASSKLVLMFSSAFHWVLCQPLIVSPMHFLMTYTPLTLTFSCWPTSCFPISVLRPSSATLS